MAFSFFTLIVSLTIFSCQKSNEKKVALSTEDREIISQFKQIGKIHNDGLDHIFNWLKTQHGTRYKGSKNSTDRKKLLQLIDIETQKFVELAIKPQNINIGEIIQNNNRYDYLIKANFGKDLSTQMRAKNNAISLSQPTTMARFVETNLSSEFYKAIDALNSLVDNEAQQDAYDQLLETQISILKNLDEKMKFASAVSIAFNTMQYWKENISKWETFFSNNDQATNSNLTSSLSPDGQKNLTLIIARTISQNNSGSNNIGRNIGKADISGIISGGLLGCGYGAIGGSVVFPGVGTLTGCAAVGAAGVITGGLGGSATAAIDAFVDWLADF